ncbi:MAG: GNAT family N-acetyltransferase [Verrucomicrobiota bacterium]
MDLILAAERPDHPDAVAPIEELQAHLGAIRPIKSRHGFRVQKLTAPKVACCVLRADGRPAACGGTMLAGRESGELKHLDGRLEFRDRRFGERLVERRARHAREHGVATRRLETGIHQQAAIRLCKRLGFRRIPPFADYPEEPLGRCCARTHAPA